jgi:hypothetical protein
VICVLKEVNRDLVVEKVVEIRMSCLILRGRGLKFRGSGARSSDRAVAVGNLAIARGRELGSTTILVPVGKRSGPLERYSVCRIKTCTVD